MVSGSRFERLLREGQFVVCGEMGPPQGADKGAILRKCAYFKDVVDAVNLTDNQTAIVRMSSLGSSVFAIEGGIEPIMQLTCRDRNRLAQQSEILSAYAFGVRNVLCLTGDYQSFGNHPGAKGAFDIDSTQLIHAVSEMNAGRFMSGDEVKPPPKMFIGGAANPFAEPLEMRVLNLEKKIAAGAHFIQTQPVFDIPRFEKWMELVRKEGLDKEVFIIAGVMPVRGAKALTYMRESVPGMSIQDEYITRLQNVAEPKKENAQEEGVKICVELIRHLKDVPGVAGVHIMPVMWESITPRIVEEAGLLPRPEPKPLEVPAVQPEEAPK